MRLLVILVFFLSSSIVLAEQVAIGLEKVGVRSRPSVLAKPKKFLKYGDMVRVSESKGRWKKIKSGKVTGWIPMTAIGKTESILRDIGKSDVEVSSEYQDEVASAAKGLSVEMEELHKKRNPKLDYKAVDSVEKFNVREKDLIKFARDGKLESEIIKSETSNR